MNRTLQFQSEKSPSIGPKTAIVSWYLVAIVAAVWLVFAGSGERGRTGSLDRQVVLLACVGLYVARAAHTLFVFVQRKVPWWEAAYGAGIIGCVLFFYLLYGLRDGEAIGPRDLVSVVLYLAGSYIGTAAEFTRHAWKSRPENQGHLYTEGLFRYARHVNYFGDLLLFTGLATVTHQAWALFVPLGMALYFAFNIIPAHDAYLAGHYGGEFDQCARRTKQLIPLVY